MNKFSNNKKRVAIVLLIAVVSTVLMPYYNSLDFTTAQKPQIKKEGIITADSSTFVVLEIVPDKAYANFGYNVAGQEPIDTKNVVGSEKVNELMSMFTIGGKEKVFTRLIEYSSITKSGFEKNANTKNVTTITFPSGYYKKVVEGSGDFILSGDHFVAKASGNYIFFEAKNNDGVAIKQFQNDQVWVKDETIAVSQLMYKKESVVNNDYFRKISLDNPNAKVIVETVTPDTLNTQINNSYLDNVDMIVISDNKNIQTNNVKLWNKYSLPSGNTAHVTGKTFAGITDLSWKTTYQIFRRVIGLDGESIPITYDTSILSAGTKSQKWSRNTDKLYLMLKKLNPIVFYNLYLNNNTSFGGEIQDVKIDNEGKYNNGSWIPDWGEDSFKPSVDTLYDAYGFKFAKLTENLGINVLDNVYCYNGSVGSVQFLDNIANDSTVTKTALTGDFFNFILNNKDKFEVNTGSGVSSTSPAYVLKYMIGYTAKSIQDSNSMVKVLDIEPCNYYKKKVSDFREMMPMCSASIEITQQTSSAFNGKLEDLNSEYNLIYLGLNYGATWYTLGSDNLPRYNDTNLNGKIYLHVGDRLIGPTSDDYYRQWNYTTGFSQFPIRAQDAVDWLIPRFRLGMTKPEEEKAIADYNAVYPLEKNQVRLPGNDITNRKAVELIDFLKAGLPIVVDSTLYNTSSAATIKKVDKTSNIFKFVNSNKVANLISEDEVNKFPNKRTDKYISAIKPLLKVISGPKKYVGKQGLVQSGSKDLYVNGDILNNRTLKYKYQIMDNASAGFMKYSAKLYVDRNADGHFTEKEKIRQRDNLVKGVYTLSVALGEEYLGAITWKLVVENANNSSIRDEEIDTCAICSSQGEKKVIKILQVKNDGGTLDLTNNQLFNDLSKDLRDYSLKIEVLTKAQYETKYNGFDYRDPVTTDGLVKNYDMIILGFRDAYEAPDPETRAVQNLTYFIQSGKTVLFTHDVTSLINKDVHLPGFAFNVHLRMYLGLDRFGARIRQYEVITNKSEHENDTAMSPENTPYSSIHGYAIWALRRLGGRKASTTVNTVPIYPNFPYDIGTYGAGLGKTTKVNQINAGQVTKYPYLIASDFDVASTHAQSYQLDMEDPNVAVWYTLAADGTRDLELETKYHLTNPESEIYGISPSDASNNYYIYNKGNVTYSAVGHDQNITLEEMKLFINTMIAAYKASVQSPMIDIQNDDIIQSGGKYYMYVNNNYAKQNYSSDKYLDIKFTPYINSLLSENMSGVVNFKGMAGEQPIYDDSGAEVKVIEKDGKLVKSDFDYTIKYPLYLLNDPQNNQITIKVKNEKGITGTVTITLLKRSLFDLD